MSTLQFSSLVSSLGYSSLACCIVSIAVSAWIKTVRQRGKNSHMLVAILACIVALLLLVPVFLWYRLRVLDPKAQVPGLESWGVLTYIFLCGCLLPLSAAIMHWLVASTSSKSQIPTEPQSGQPITDQQPVTTLQPPRYQPGSLAPYVFREDTPWGWLEYKNGNFQGQRLALKRAIATIGRDEDCDIWLDDEQASRHHAELAWHNAQICLTDCGSLNGVQLNGERVQGTVLISSNDIIEIGDQRFSFILAEQKEILADQYDPLVNHTWRSSADLQADPDTSGPLPAAMQLDKGKPVEADADDLFPQGTMHPDADYLVINSGERAGERITLEGPINTIGRGVECTIMLNDLSVAPLHARIIKHAGHVYLQDMADHNTTFINDQLITAPGPIKPGDIIRVGDIRLGYGKVSRLSNTTMPPIPVTKSMSGPVPLRLPSRSKPH
ncbi:hypothetical protein KDA_24380 [Dictyobacter alpinus]|uniref:FHA domain-containing protein n=1 Tax=Dictyobacter alpinus TaxID=2014873 RepID=A0A402B6I0_9CHLR|nr:FHA domain-containing protein [Dictyobacter alpinus]GCE26954.1 hypothetical protein KDA_24380 [Dictyobacter alpinus]